MILEYKNLISDLMYVRWYLYVKSGKIYQLQEALLYLNYRSQISASVEELVEVLIRSLCMYIFQESVSILLYALVITQRLDQSCRKLYLARYRYQYHFNTILVDQER